MTLHGEYDYSELIKYPSIILEKCNQEQIFKILIHRLDYVPKEHPVIEQFFLGENLAEVLRDKVKVAMVRSKEAPNRLIETVAINRAGYVKMFNDMEKAKEWLLMDNLDDLYI